MNKPKILDSGAIFDADKIHRYSLWRTWNYDQPRILFIGLNPSRADAIKNDPTITRCINFANSWGFGSLYFANLFSFRTPYVDVAVNRPDVEEQWLPLTQTEYPVYNSDTDNHLDNMINRSEKTVICWGAWKYHFIANRAIDVLARLHHWSVKPFCFGINADKSPKHPLYLKSNTELTLYQP
jgi:hypothetical protein